MTSPHPRQAADQAAPASAPTAEAVPAMPDFEAMSRNAGQLVEALGRSAARYLKPEVQAEIGRAHV